MRLRHNPTRSLIVRWTPRAYGLIAALLIPWIIWLSISLPRRATAAHYRLAWVGFDCMLVAAFARTGYLAAQRREQTELAAVVTATLLVVDAWFDITTASTRAQLLQAVLLAIFGELPAALLSIFLVRRVNRAVLRHLGSPYLLEEPDGLSAEERAVTPTGERRAPGPQSPEGKNS